MPIPMRHANADAKSREDDDRFVLDGLRRRRSRRPRARATDERAEGPSITIRQRLLLQLKCLLTDRSRRIPPPLRGCRPYAPCGSEGSKAITLGGLLNGAGWCRSGLGKGKHIAPRPAPPLIRRRSACRSSLLSTSAISSSSPANAHGARARLSRLIHSLCNSAASERRYRNRVVGRRAGAWRR